MCPPQVLRYATYTTAASRTSTIRGLDKDLKYDIEFYASRSTAGNTSIFIINGVSKSVVTYNNKSNNVVFIDVSPNNNGQIIVSLNKSGTFSYLNGFTLIEKSLTQYSNQLPVAAAGEDISINLPMNNVEVNGSGSFDPDGTINSYNWTMISGPGSYLIVNPSNSITDIENLSEGTYQFELQVTDNYGDISKDTIAVTVINAGPRPPVCNAGSDVVIHVPQGSYQLNGNGSFDPDGSISSYLWTKLSGPGSYSISNNAIVNPVISSLVNGVYRMELLVSDNDGNVARDTMEVVVNIPPVSAAGSDVERTLPQNSVVMNGSGSSDADGSITSYQWTRLSGPLQYSISSATSVSPTISNLVKGVYEFQLQVTDNRGATGSDVVRITVYGMPNVAPVAQAGNDQNIVLPTSSTSLNGTASSDADGSIVTYQWSQVSGPNTANIVSPGSATTTVSGLVEGSYQFQLQVRDDSSATDTDIMVVNVAPPSVTKLIKVNLYGGSNAYNQDGWNNWNVTGSTNITSGTLNYENGTSSGVSAVLSYAQGVADNGSTYGGSMCPPQVLRYASYSTSTRTVTLNGLNNTLVYDLELYASRANSGNSTRFIINGVSVTVVTDQNKTVKVNFTDIAPSNGRIVITLERVGTYNYLNGFVLAEKAGQPALRTGPLTVAEDVQPGDQVFGVNPNPFRSGVQLSLQNSYKGSMKVWISDAGGKLVRSMNYVKTTRTFTTQIRTSELPAGVYLMHLEIEGRIYSRKLLKIN